MTGLGVITMTWFPFALPGLVLAVALALPLLVLALPAALIWLLVRGVSRLLGRGAAPDQAAAGAGSGLNTGASVSPASATASRSWTSGREKVRPSMPTSR
jgi:hypothetical protein